MIDLFSEHKECFNVIKQSEIDELYNTIRKSRVYDDLLNKKITLKEYEKLQRNAHEAKEKLISSNIKVIIKISKKYFIHDEDIEEAINEGTFGLLDAIEKYDPSRTRFVTYIFFYIEKYILILARKKNAKIKLPSYVIDLSNKIVKAKQEFENNNISYTDEMITEKLGISSKKYKNILSANSIRELNYNLDDETTKFSDLDDLSTDKKSNSNLLAVHDAVSKLNEPEKTIIEEFYGFNDQTKSIHYIATKLNMTPHNIKIIKESAEQKIKEIIKNIDFGDSYELCSSHRHVS